MLISQLIELAKGGELSNLSEESFEDTRVMGYINLGLIELYKRFELKSAEALITMDENRTLYTLDSTDTNVQIDTSAMDIMAITEAWEESGKQLTVNVENDEYGIMTPTYNQVQIPNPAEGEVLSVIYTAGPTWVSSLTDQLQIPISLLEALLHYIGYRAHGSLDGNIQAENNTHYQRFEASVKRAKLLGVVTADSIADRPNKIKGF